MNLPLIGFVELWVVIVVLAVIFWAASSNRRGRAESHEMGESVCPRAGCGCMNPNRAKFCRNCGLALTRERSRGHQSSAGDRR